MELLLSEQQDWYWPGVANQIRGLSGKGLYKPEVIRKRDIFVVFGASGCI